MSKEDILARFQSLELDDLVRFVDRHQNAVQKAAAIVLLEFCEHTRSVVSDYLSQPVKNYAPENNPAAEMDPEQDEFLTWFHLVREGLSGRAVESDLVNRLVKVMEDYEVPHQFIFDFLRGVAQERALGSFRDRSELRTWACLVSSSMWLAVLKIFGVELEQQANLDSIIDLGVAILLLDKLIATRMQLECKRFYFAQDELIDRSLDLYCQVEPIDDDLWKDLIQFQCRCIEDFLQSSTRLGESLEGPVKRRIVFLVTEKWRLLKKVRRQPIVILREKIVMGGFDRFKLNLRLLFGAKMPKIGSGPA